MIAKVGIAVFIWVLTWIGGASLAFAHGTVMSQMKVATQKVSELFEKAQPQAADQLTETRIEKTGEEKFRVILTTPAKSFVYDCGLDIPTVKKWGCRLQE